MNYYFANAGDDSNDGSIGTPFQTIGKLNFIFSTLNAGDNIFFNRGDVFYGGIVANKSGAAGNPIVFQDYGSGDLPVITGFFDTTGIYDDNGDGTWQTSTATTLPTVNMVAISGVVAPIGKWPNGGFTYEPIDSHTGGDLDAGGAHSITSGVSLPFDFTGGQVVIRKRHWIIDKATINSQAGDTINYTNPSIYGSIDGFGYFVQNHRSACDIDGEWWYEAGSNIFGIRSTGAPSGVNITNVEILADINSQSYLNFINIKFIGSNSATVKITSGHHINFLSCDLQEAGKDCFTVQTAAHHISIISCTSDIVNNNFITGGGSQNWTITSNIITNVAQIPGMGESRDGTYIGMYNIGSNSLIQYNDIDGIGYNAIDFRGGNIQVLNNLVQTFCNVKDDGAGIYTFTGASTTVWAQRTVDHNIVLDGVGAPDGTNTSNTDVHGIYMDDNSSQVTISNNTVAHMGGAGIFLHANHNITLTNNTVFDCATTTPGVYAQIYEVYPGVVSTAPVRNLTVTGNKFISKQSTQLVASYKTNETDMSQWPTGLTNANFNNNYYARPVDDPTDTIQVIRSSGTILTDLPGWVAASGGNLDSTSHISPIAVADPDSIVFLINPTNGTVTESLSGNYLDVTGAGYSGSIDIPAWGSAVLFPTDESIPPVEPFTSVTVSFQPCVPAPAEGYQIFYRVIGDTEYIDAGFFTSSPATIFVSSGSHFEGYIKSDCGDVFWTSA